MGGILTRWYKAKSIWSLDFRVNYLSVFSLYQKLEGEY